MPPTTTGITETTDTALRAAPATVRLAGTACVAGAALLWGTVGVLVRGIAEAAPGTNALAIGFVRLAVAGPVLLLAHLLAARTHPLRLARRDWPAALVFGGALAAYQAAEFAAIPRLGVTRTILLAICAAPAFIALFAALALRERTPLRALPPALLALVGVALLVGGGGGDATTAPADALGVALALAAAAMYALVVTASRALAPRYPAAQTMATATLVGAVALAPPALASGAGAFALGARGWLLAVALGLVPTVAGYLLFLRGLRAVTATTAGVLSLLEPLAAATLAAALFGERLAPVSLAGAGLLLGSLALFVAASGERDAGPSGP